MNVSCKYVGPMASWSGYGEASRTFVNALHEVGVDVTTKTVYYDNSRTNYFGNGYQLARSLEDRDIHYDIKIIHTPADGYVKYLEPCKFHIARLVWETDKMPPEWAWQCNLMNEVWTGSDTTKKAFEKSGIERPVWVYPETFNTGMDIDNFAPLKIQGHTGFLFGSVFQFIQRKNPKALVEAYVKEFSSREDISLVMKTYKERFSVAEKKDIVNQIQAWKKEFKETDCPRIGVITNLMDKADVFRFYKALDCFVLPHRGEGWCIFPGTEIITNNGLRKIEDCDKKGVFTHNGRFKKASLLRRDYNGKMIKITPYYSNSVILTPEHRLLTIPRKSRTHFDRIKKKPEWKEAKDIKRGDLVCFPRLKEVNDCQKIDILEYVDNLRENDGFVFPSSGGNNKAPVYKIKRHLLLNNDFLFLCGLFLAEGSTRNKRELVFSLNQREKSLIKKVKSISNSLFGIAPRQETMTRNKINLVIGSGVLGKLFAKLFKTGAKNKSMPHWMLFLSEDKVKFLIKGMWDGDGSIYKETKVIVGSYSTISKVLAWQLWLCLNRFCVDPISILGKDRKNANKEWQVKIKGNDNCQALSFLFPNYKKQRVNRKNGRGDSKYLYFVVRSIETKQYSGKVYNLQVEDDETYTTSGFLVHNCRPLMEAMFCGKPVIATNLGGIHDFLPHETYYPLSHRMIKVFDMEWAPHYRQDQQWADVSVDELRKKMRYVYEHRDEAKEVGKRAMNFVKNRFSYESVGRAMKDRLRDIQKHIDAEKRRGIKWLSY